MADGPERLVHVLLRRLDGKVECFADDVQDSRARVSSMKENTAVMSPSLDRVEAGLERIERRLDLVEQPH